MKETSSSNERVESILVRKVFGCYHQFQDGTLCFNVWKAKVKGVPKQCAMCRMNKIIPLSVAMKDIDILSTLIMYHLALNLKYEEPVNEFLANVIEYKARFVQQNTLRYYKLLHRKVV